MTDNSGTDEQDPVQALARQQMMLGGQQMAAFGRTSDPAHLDAAIRAWETVLELSRASPFSEIVAVERAAEYSFMMRWRLTRRPADLKRVLAERERLDDAPVNGPDETIVHQTLVAEALQGRFDEHGNLADLDEAADRLRQALDVCTDDNPLRRIIEDQLSRDELAQRIIVMDEQFTASIVRPMLDKDDECDLKIRALSYFMRYQAGGPRTDAREAIALYERAIRVAQDTESAADVELSVGKVHTALFHRNGSPAELDDAIVRYTRAVGAIRDTDKFREGLRLLLNAHTTRTKAGAIPASVAEALDTMHRYVDDDRLDPTARTQIWTSISFQLQQRALAEHRREDVTAAIEAARRAAAEAADTAVLPAALSHLATGLGLRLELFGDNSDLHEAATVSARAAEASEEDDDARVLRHLNAAKMWLLVGERDRDLKALDRALALLATVERTEHELRPAVLLQQQLTRQERLTISEDPADLDAAIAAGLVVWNSPADRVGQYGTQSAIELGKMLHLRGTMTHSTPDLDAAYRVGLSVTSTLPEKDPGLPDVLYRLVALPARDLFDLTDAPDHLDRAVDAAERALAVAVDPDDAAEFCIGMCAMLRDRFARRDDAADQEDLRAAIRRYESVLTRLQPDHPDRSRLLVEMARTFRLAFHAGRDLADARTALGHARAAAEHPAIADPARAHAWALCADLAVTLAAASDPAATVDDAVRFGEAALGEASSPMSVYPRWVLYRALSLRYNRNDDDADFRRAVDILTAVTGESSGGAERAEALACAARLHRLRFDRRHEPADLDRAINLLEDAASAAAAESPMLVRYADELYRYRNANAANAGESDDSAAAGHAARGRELSERFAMDHDQATAEAAVTAWFAAALLDPDRFGPGLAAATSSADNSTVDLRTLHSLYFRLATTQGRPDWSKEAGVLVDMLRQRWRAGLESYAAETLADAAVLLAARTTEPELALRCADSLFELFTLSGEPSLLTAAIDAYSAVRPDSAELTMGEHVRRQLETARQRIGDPLNRVRAAADRANAWFLLGPSAERATALLTATREAAAGAPAGHREHASLRGNVANAALLVAQFTDDTATAADAVTAARAASDAADNDVLRAKARFMLAAALLQSVAHAFDADAVDEALTLAASLFGDSSHDAPARSLTAELLLERLDHDTDTDQRDLHRAVQYAREALEALDDTSANRMAAEFLLTRALLRRFLGTRDVDDLAEALRQLGEGMSGIAAAAGLLAAGLDDPASRPPPDVLLAGLDPVDAGHLAEMVAGLVPAVDDDDLAEWLLNLPVHLVAPDGAPHARQRYLFSSAEKLKEQHPSLALRLLRRITAELADADDRDGQSGAAQAWTMIGSITESAEDWDLSFEAYKHAMHLYRKLKEPGSEIYRLRDMAVVCARRGDESTALNHFDEALRRVEETGNDELEPDLLMLSAPSAGPTEAARRMERAVALWTAGGHRNRAHHGHVSRAILAVAQQDAATAALHAHAAADLAATAEEAETSYVVVWRTMVTNKMYEEARTLEEPTAAAFHRASEPYRAANALYNYAMARQAAGDIDGALQSFATARQEFLALDNMDGVATVDGHIAGLHLEAGDYDRAVAGFRTAADRFATAKKWDKAALGYRNAAALWFELNDAEVVDRSAADRASAIADLTKSLEYAERAEDPSVRFSILLVQARLDEEGGQRAAAAQRLAEAAQLAGTDVVRAAMVEELKAQLAGLRGDLVEQQEALENARDLFKRAEKPRSAGAAAHRLALVYEELGEIRQARTAMQFAIDNFDAEEPIATGPGLRSVISTSPELLEAMRAKLARWDLQLGDVRRSLEELAGLSTEHLPPDQRRHLAAHLAMKAARAAGDLADALRIGQETLSNSTDPRLRSLLLHDLSPTARELGLIELAYDYAAEGAELAEDTTLRIAHLRNLGSAARVRGRVDEAVGALRRAAALLDTTDRTDPTLELDVLNSLALGLIVQGGWPEADQLVAKGLTLARSSGQRRQEASLLQSRGHLCLVRGNYEDAYVALRESIRIQEDLGGDELLAGAYANLGLVQLRRGQRDEARELTERALLAERRTGQTNGVVLNLLTLAELAEDNEAAERYLIEALDISRRNGFRSGVGRALFGIGAVALRQDDITAALARFTEAIGIFREVGEAPHLVMGLLQRSITAGAFGDLPAALDDAEEADRIQQTVTPGQDLSYGPGAAVLDQLITLYARTQRGADAWRRVERSKTRDLLAQLSAEELPAPKAVDRPSDLDAITNQGAIGLLGFYLGPSSAVVLVYRRELEEPVAILRTRLPDTVFDKLRRAHGEPVPVILHLRDKDGSEDEVKTDMRHVPYRALIQELLPVIGDDLDLLYLLPHRQMNQIPLHALGPDGDTLLDRAPVAYAPSAAVLRRLLDRPRTGKERPSQVLGYAPPEDREARILIEETATDVAAKLKVEARRAARATSDQIAGKWNILHLSGHGEFHEHDPLGSGIWLADGLLTARKIMRMRIDADLVVVGACKSGQSGHDEAVDAAGLGYALLYAGARCALLTLWPVEAETTRILLDSFYNYLLLGRPKAVALRQAVLDLRKLSGKDLPSIWGAYVLLGDAG